MIKTNPAGDPTKHYSHEELRYFIEALKKNQEMPMQGFALKYGDEVIVYFLQINLSKEKTDGLLKDTVAVFPMESLDETERNMGLNYFYVAYRKVLQTYLKNHTLETIEHDQQEIIQDTFLVFNKIACSGILREKYFSKGTPSIAVLYGILKIIIKKYLFKKSKAVQLTFDEGLLDAADIPDSAFDILIESERKTEFEQRVINCFPHGPEYCPGLLKQLLYYDMALDIYAVKAGISQVAARKQKSRCIQQLKACLGMSPSDDEDLLENRTKNIDDGMDNQREEIDDEQGTLKDAIRQAENKRLRDLLGKWDGGEHAIVKPEPRVVSFNRYWRIAASLLLLIAATMFIRPPKADEAIVASYSEELRFFSTSLLKGAGSQPLVQFPDSIVAVAADHIINNQHAEALLALNAVPDTLHSEYYDFLFLLAYLGKGDKVEANRYLNKIQNNPRHLYYDKAFSINKQRSWRIQTPSFGD